MAGIVQNKIPVRLGVQVKLFTVFLNSVNASKQISHRIRRNPVAVLAGFTLGIGAIVAASSTQAQTASSSGPTVFTEQGKLIRAPQAVTTLGADLFGDKVNLYTGRLEFIHNDVSLPGNSSLPVAVGRRLSTGHSGYSGAPSNTGSLVNGLFKEWELEIPHLHGVFANEFGWGKLDSSGQLSNQRCSNFGAPPEAVRAGRYKAIQFRAVEYWHGNSMYIPGIGDQEILKRNIAGNANVPADGIATPLVTKGLWAIRCLSSLASTDATTVKNEAGEGFLAIAPDGTQYRFDWLVSRPLGSMPFRVELDF